MRLSDATIAITCALLASDSAAFSISHSNSRPHVSLSHPQSDVWRFHPTSPRTITGEHRATTTLNVAAEDEKILSETSSTDDDVPLSPLDFDYEKSID